MAERPKRRAKCGCGRPAIAGTLLVLYSVGTHPHVGKFSKAGHLCRRCLEFVVAVLRGTSGGFPIDVLEDFQRAVDTGNQVR